MRYESFRIRNYRAIKDLTINLDKKIIPIIGINECGKTTILQAIFAFDPANDKLSGGKHLESLNNLYETKHEPTKITATISLSPEEQSLIVNSIEDTHAQILLKQELKSPIQITRTISKNENSYTSDIFFDIDYINKDRDTAVSESIVNTINSKIKKVVFSLTPHIIYNDDFNDRPESVIDMADKNNEWVVIVSRIFEENGYTLDKFNESEERTKKSILNDLNNDINKKFTTEWSKFSHSNGDSESDLKINIDHDVAKNHFTISVVETPEENKGRFFNIEDRSKGFIWCYNFIFKTLYSPKQSREKGSTLFLLDEPGSYLHAQAQTMLCKKINEISQSEGTVIYCTHTPQLLNPEYIPTNNVIIATKKAKKGITIETISTHKGKSKDTHLQPIYDALQIPEYSSICTNSPVVCVEGIHDKYALEIFANLDSSIRILPCSNAASINRNISYMLCYGINYVALWDNDKEGQKNKKSAVNDFGSHEARRMLLLPDGGMGRARMEEMINTGDYSLLKQELELDEKATYPSILYALKEIMKGKGGRNKVDAILAKISDKTKGNFIKIKKSIEEILLKAGNQEA